MLIESYTYTSIRGDHERKHEDMEFPFSLVFHRKMFSCFGFYFHEKLSLVHFRFTNFLFSFPYFRSLAFFYLELESFSTILIPIVSVC
jgi:hypothetical protein